MNINPSIFRAYDIRGVYPEELNEDGARKIAQSFVFLYPWAEKLVIAADPRLSSPILKQTMIDVFVGAGKTVIDLGTVPDPLFYFILFNHKLDGGVMISGSHNPKEYNGLTLSIRRKDSDLVEDLIGPELEKIRDLALGNTEINIPKGKGEAKLLDISEEYIKYVSSLVKINKPLKILIDSGNGSIGLLAERLFRAIGCEANTMYADPDGNFPNHLPDPYEKENLKDIKEGVVAGGYDLGFAFDADGDRVAPIDKRGKEVSGDDCLLILARQAIRKKRGPIVHCMRASAAFLDEMKKEGITTYFSVSHHNAVIKKVMEIGASFGGEITYHFLFPLDYYLVDDALFASLKLAEIASQQESFIDYLDSLPKYTVSPEVFIPTDDSIKFQLIKNLQQYLRDNNYNFIDIDGARINFDGGWALIRASNTSPFIKCRFEGRDDSILKDIERKSLDIFEKNGIQIPIEIKKELGIN
ncbi:MAG: phosphomannomutase/phosphoglucomutase [Candidatus Parcubacteria bacterium]|nr:phosphomannomutase/phosphoglucomutase [Candidatus Parcubacteria bacterium]